MKIWNTHVHVYVYIFCVTVSKIISTLLEQVALQSQFIIRYNIYIIPGVKSIVYIESLLAVWQVNVKEEKLIVRQRSDQKKGKGGVSRCEIPVDVIKLSKQF